MTALSLPLLPRDRQDRAASWLLCSGTIFSADIGCPVFEIRSMVLLSGIVEYALAPAADT